MAVAKDDRLVRDGIEDLRLSVGEEANGAMSQDTRAQAVGRRLDAVDRIDFGHFAGMVRKESLRTCSILGGGPLITRDRAVSVPMDADKDRFRRTEAVVVVEIAGVPGRFLLCNELANCRVIEQLRGFGRRLGREQGARCAHQRSGYIQQMSQPGLSRQHSSPAAQRKCAVYIPHHGAQ